GGEIGHALARISAEPRPRRGDVLLERALGDAEGRARDDEGEEGEPRQAEDRRSIDGAAGTGTALAGLGREGAVLGHEDVVDDDILAAGAGEAAHIPGVDHRIVAGGQQEYAV